MSFAMKLTIFNATGCLAIACLLGACSFASQQLSDKRMEDQLLRPGALDSPVATNFDEYLFKFMDKYRIVHAWPVTSACKYSKLRTKYTMGEMSYGDVYSVDDIYEDGNITKQRDVTPGTDFNRFVRSVLVRRPVYATTSDGIKGNEIAGYYENEEGFKPICFEAWAGTSHAVTIFLHKRTVNEWKEALTRWSLGSYMRADAKQSVEIVTGNSWHVFRLPLKPREMNRVAGSYELRILPIGNTGYTMALELGANVESLQNPQAHAAFEAMFKRLIESVKIEPLTPAIEAEMAQLKSQAFEIVRKDCIRMSQRSNPPAYRRMST